MGHFYGVLLVLLEFVPNGGVGNVAVLVLPKARRGLVVGCFDLLFFASVSGVGVVVVGAVVTKEDK